MPTTITATRMSNGDTEECVLIEIREDRRIVFKGHMTLENFALAITGRSEVPFSDAHELPRPLPITKYECGNWLTITETGK